MGAPLKTIKTLRVTAKVLLIATPLMVLSGFLTAKPFLYESLDFATARLIHTIIAPLVFIPLLVAHSTAGVLYILNRSKRFKSRSSRSMLAGLWVALLVLLSALYFTAQPPEISLGDASWEGDDEIDAGAGTHDGAPDGNTEDITSSDADIVADGQQSDALGRLDAKRLEDQPRTKAAIGKVRKLAHTKRPPYEAPAAPPVQKKLPSKEITREDNPPPTPPSPALSGSKLVRERCIGCHPLGSIYSKKMSSSEWRSVVGRMVALGAKLDPAERQAVLRHLIGSHGSGQ